MNQLQFASWLAVKKNKKKDLAYFKFPFTYINHYTDLKVDSIFVLIFAVNFKYRNRILPKNNIFKKIYATKFFLILFENSLFLLLNVDYRF